MRPDLSLNPDCSPVSLVISATSNGRFGATEPTLTLAWPSARSNVRFLTARQAAMGRVRPTDPRR